MLICSKIQITNYSRYYVKITKITIFPTEKSRRKKEWNCRSLTYNLDLQYLGGKIIKIIIVIMVIDKTTRKYAIQQQMQHKTLYVLKSEKIKKIENQKLK